MIVAQPETDLKIIHVAKHFYQNYNMKRVYYSGYVPVLEDKIYLPFMHKFQCKGKPTVSNGLVDAFFMVLIQ